MFKQKGRFILADLLPEDCRLLGVSATLEISNRVSLADLLGFPEAPLVRLDVAKQEQQEVSLVDDFPLVTEVSPVDYASEVASVIRRLTSLSRTLIGLVYLKRNVAGSFGPARPTASSSV